MRALSLSLCLLAVSLMASCGHVSKMGMFKNSALNDLNPAPEKFAPPKNYDKKVDQFHMQSTADYQFSLGETYALDGQTQKAIEAFKAALVYDNKAIAIRLRLAEEYVKSGRFAEALEEAEYTLTLDDRYIPTRILLGNLYSSLKMYDLAISQFHVVLDIEPENEQAPLFIGAILAEQKKYDEAIEHFKALTKSNKSDKIHMFHYYIGRIYSERGEDFYGKAEEAYSDSLRNKPDFQRSVVALARLYIKKGQLKSAVQLLTSFQEKFLAEREVARLLSQIYIETEQFDEAYEQLKILEGYDHPLNLGLKLQMALMLIRIENFGKANEKL
ncbi:MAG: tetratricopeptide repeat protein [Bdellovibrionales bacterium]